jgi:hypothetical protein
VFRDVEQLFARDEWFQWRYNIRLQAAVAEHLLRTADFARASERAARLDASARQYGARKYIAVAGLLRARIALAQGDETAARDDLVAASELLQKYPAPLVAWKIDALLALIENKVGTEGAARDAHARATATIAAIVASIRDEAQRARFLQSAGVTKALAGGSVP